MMKVEKVQQQEGGRLVRTKNAAVAGGSALVAMLGVMVMGVALAGPSSAQTADPVVGEMQDMGTKVALYGAGVLALVAVGLAIWLGVKYFSKATSRA